MKLNEQSKVETIIKGMVSLADQLGIDTKKNNDAYIVSAILMYKVQYDRFMKMLCEYSETICSVPDIVLNTPQLQIFYEMNPQIIEFGSTDTQDYLFSRQEDEEICQLFLETLKRLSGLPSNRYNQLRLLNDNDAFAYKKSFEEAVAGTFVFLDGLDPGDRNAYVRGIFQILNRVYFE